MTDQTEKGNLFVIHCPTDEMIDNFVTKGFQGKKFSGHRKEIMGFDHCEHDVNVMKNVMHKCKLPIGEHW